MPELIQSVVPVMTIADQILKLKIIHQETYDQIEASSVNQDRMRKLFRALNSPKAKAAFYDILGKIQPETCESMLCLLHVYVFFYSYDVCQR